MDQNDISEAEVLDIVGMIIDEDESIVDAVEASDQAAYLLGLDPEWVYSLVQGGAKQAEDDYQLDDRWDAEKEALDREDQYYRAMESRILREANELEGMSKVEVLRQYFDENASDGRPEGLSYGHYLNWVGDQVGDMEDIALRNQYAASRPFYNKVKKAKFGGERSPRKATAPAKRKPSKGAGVKPGRPAGPDISGNPEVDEALNYLGNRVVNNLEDEADKMAEKYDRPVDPQSVVRTTGLSLFYVPAGHVDDRPTAGVILDTPREMRHPDEYPQDLDNDGPPSWLLPYFAADNAGSEAWMDAQRKYYDQDVNIEMMADLPWMGGKSIGTIVPLTRWLNS